ncbi:MAG TPA: type IX secretion system protein PorQ [Flavobacteriales bacterium]|nr:type IX secretion system protein PorQ [Flavobacteriales bacterium]
MQHRILLLSAFALIHSVASSQIGGSSAFRVLDVPMSARASALGGNYIAVKDNDINLGIYNPALLNKEMSKQVALSYLPYFEGIKMGYASYAHHCDSLNTTFAGTVQYVNYGTFNRTDETGQGTGTFTSGEYAVQVGAGRMLDSLFSIGANVKLITSNYENNTSTAWAFDVGGTYHKPLKGITISALLRNYGKQTSSFTDKKEELPFQVQLGITYKFPHAPFRLGLMMEQLQKWDLTLHDPNAAVEIDPTTGEVITKKITNARKALLHAVPSAEILLSKNFMLRVGYNFRKRNELVIADKPSAVGLSFGLGLRVSKFHISYGFSQLHLAGISNTFTIAARFADFKKG